MATHSSALAWKIPWTEDPGRLQFMGSQRVDMTKRLHFTSLQYLIVQIVIIRDSLMVQVVKNLPAMQGTQVQSFSVGQEDPLEKY